jgi:hypothetical protein
MDSVMTALFVLTTAGILWWIVVSYLRRKNIRTPMPVTSCPSGQATRMERVSAWGYLIIIVLGSVLLVFWKNRS